MTTKNVPITESGLEIIDECLLLAKGLHWQRITNIVLEGLPDRAKSIKRHLQRIEEINNLIRHIALRLPRE